MTATRSTSECASIVPVIHEPAAATPTMHGSVETTAMAFSTKRRCAVGTALVHPGTLIKFRANSLAACRSPAPGRGSCRNLRAKSSTPFVFSPSEVWAAGGRGNITRWDGTKLTLLPTGTNQYVTGIWGASPNEVWIAGTGGMVRHYDGSFTAVTGRASDDIWASTSSALYHWNGVNWSNMGAVSSAADLWASGPNEVFVLGANHTSYFNLATSIDLGAP